MLEPLWSMLSGEFRTVQNQTNILKNPVLNLETCPVRPEPLTSPNSAHPPPPPQGGASLRQVAPTEGEVLHKAIKEVSLGKWQCQVGKYFTHFKKRSHHTSPTSQESDRTKLMLHLLHKRTIAESSHFTKPTRERSL